MFEQMNIAEYIHEGVVETYYKNPTRADANRSGNSGQDRGEATSSQTHPVMDEIAGKHRKRYVDCLSSESKTCLIHGPGHSHDKWKVLGDFGAKYAKGKPTKDHRNYPVPRKKFNRQQGNNAIVNNAVDEILLHETQKVSAMKEAPELFESDYDENELYQVENMSLE